MQAALRAPHAGARASLAGPRHPQAARRVASFSSKKTSTLRSAHHRSATVVVSAAASSSSDPSAVKVVGVGSAGVDYLASIAAFPEPDAKLRTDALAGMEPHLRLICTLKTP